MSSIFRLEEIRSYDSEEHWYRDASIGIVGHYSSLEKVMKAMRTNNQETWDAEEIMAYLVKEIAVDGEIGEVSWLSVRSYDRLGTLIDECLQDYNLCNQFEGRNPETIRFRLEMSLRCWKGAGSILPSWQPFRQLPRTISQCLMPWMIVSSSFHWILAPSSICILLRLTPSPCNIR